MRIFFPRTFMGCLLGMCGVTLVGLGLLFLSDFLPEKATPIFALGIPAAGGAGLLYYFFRLAFVVTIEESIRDD